VCTAPSTPVPRCGNTSTCSHERRAVHPAPLS
jgi:hypothetical protein